MFARGLRTSSRNQPSLTLVRYSPRVIPRSRRKLRVSARLDEPSKIRELVEIWRVCDAFAENRRRALGGAFSLHPCFPGNHGNRTETTDDSEDYMKSDEIIASRTFKGFRQGVALELTVLIGRPLRAVAPDTYFWCPYEITGDTAEQGARQARGVDALQALQLALRMLEVDLTALREECDGQLWWDLAPRLGLGLSAPEH